MRTSEMSVKSAEDGANTSGTWARPRAARTVAAFLIAGALGATVFAWTPTDLPNTPMGTPKGIHPGRVVWIRDLAATPWDGSTGHWWDDETGIKQSAVDAMLSRSLRDLTGAKNDAKAWEQLFRYSNQVRGRSQKGFAKGEKIAIKINCNNAYAGYGDADNQADASPQTLLAILRQLVRNARVPEESISVYEAVRVIPDRVFETSHREFPRVVFVDSKGDGTNGRFPVEWQEDVLGYSVKDPKVGRSVPKCVKEASYLVNMALLKGHPTTGFTLTAKNHYGTIGAPGGADPRDHKVYVNASKHPMGIYHPFVDMIGHKELGAKTVLFMVDGLYGLRDVNDDVSVHGHWKTMFGGEWLASLFLSQDPLAIDSVGFDLLNAEFPEGRGGTPLPLTNADNFLHEGALADKAPSGTVYSPNGDGVPLRSLGVHEHWNNATDRKYTGTGKGIELFLSKLDKTTR